MPNTPMVTVAGTALPEPSTYEGNTATIVDSARNVKGVMVGAVIRENVGKVSLGWNFLTVSEWANILALFDSTRGGNFINSVTFFCQDTGTWETRNMYVSDRNASVFIRDALGNITGYQNPKLSLIEV